MPAATGKLSIWVAKMNSGDQPGQGGGAVVELAARAAQGQPHADGGDDRGAHRGRGVEEAVGDVHGSLLPARVAAAGAGIGLPQDRIAQPYCK